MAEVMAEEEHIALPSGSAGKRSGGWWGMLAVIATEGALFAYLIFSYLYLSAMSPVHWPPEGQPKLGLAGLNTGILLSSSVFVWLGERLVRKARPRVAAASLGFGIVLGVVFVGIQVQEWRNHPYGPTTHLYGSLYFTITGFHMVHVVIGLLALMVLLVWVLLGYFDARRYAALTIGGLYWHFVDVVWLFIFTTLYVSPYWS